MQELRGSSVVREGLIFRSRKEFLCESVVSASAELCIDPVNKSSLVQIISF